MKIESALTRLLNQPVKNRMYQGINGLIVQLAGRSIKVSHLLEYPKCGGTWVRNMMQTYLGGKPYLVNHLLKPKTVIHLHRKYSDRFSYPIVLFRDPRDVYVSYYFYEKSLAEKNKKLAINRYISFGKEKNKQKEFADYLAVKLTKLTDPYFTYMQFIESWLGRKDVCYVYYEGFHKSPKEELMKIIEFLNVGIEKDKLEHAIDYNNFENVTLRKYGKSRKKGEEESGNFQRKGVVGDWVNHFNKEACDIMNLHMGEAIIQLGYEANNNWANEIYCKPIMP